MTEISRKQAIVAPKRCATRNQVIKYETAFFRSLLDQVFHFHMFLCIRLTDFPQKGNGMDCIELR